MAGCEGRSGHGRLWRWAVLLAFSWHTACNSFMFMNFAAVSGVSKELFNIDNSQLNWLYSASLLGVLPLAFPCAYLLSRHNYPTALFSVICNVSGAALRYFSAHLESYPLALLSSVLLGFAAAVIIWSPNQIAEAWFPISQRPLAITMAVQANYTGWCIGVVVIPHAVGSVADLRALLLFQLIAVAASVPLFLLFHRPPPTSPTLSPLMHHLDSKSPITSLSMLMTRRKYVIEGVCFALLGAISFTLPAVQDQIFSDLGYSDTRNSFTNFGFVLSGIVTGLTTALIFGHKTYTHKPILVSLFAICALSLTTLTVLSHIARHFSHDTLYIINITFMSLAGAGCLGFIGIGLSASARAGKPVTETYSGGLVEWFLQLFAVVLTQVGHGFVVCAAVSWVVLLALCISFFWYREPTRYVGEEIAVSTRHSDADSTDA